MVRVSNLAEGYGFHSIWLCDHFLTTSPEDYVQDAGITSAGGVPQSDNRSAPDIHGSLGRVDGTRGAGS